MNRLRAVCLGPALVAALAVGAHAVEGPESTAFHFLNLGAGPRIQALAGAGTAISEGADALTWNPALLAGQRSSQISGSYFNWLDGVHAGYVGGVHPLGGGGVLGASVRSVSVSDFGNVAGQTEVGQSDFAAAVAGAYGLDLGIDAGLAVKVVRSTLADEAATGWAVDAGMNYRYVEGWNVAAALRNWGPAFGYVDGVDEQLPTQTAVGIGGTVGELHVDSEVLWENGPGWTSAVGIEYWFRDRLALRVGSRFGEEAGDAVEPWAAGFGVRARHDLLVDYSFRDGTLDPSHRVGIRWNIGGDAEDPGDLPRSPRAFYRDVLDTAIEQGLVTFPRNVGDTIVVRPKVAHEVGPVITSVIVERLREWGLNAEAREAEPELDPEMQEQVAKARAEAGLPPEGEHPVLQYEIRASEYSILRSKRARWIGPRSIDRRAEIDLAFDLQSTNGESLWSAVGRGEETEKAVVSSRVPSSPGYPRAQGTETSGPTKLHPLLEPAIVGGIVTGLAVIFFTNREVGN